MDKKKKIMAGAAAIVAVIVIYFGYHFLMYVETDNAQIDAHTVLIASKVPGYISAVNVTQGQKVKKGEILIQIDDRDFKSSLIAAQSEVQSLEARKKDSEKNYLRLKELVSKSVVSPQQFDAATANYHEIKAKYDSAVARVTQAELNVEYSAIRAPSDGIIARSSAEVGQLAAPGTPLVGFVSSEGRWVTANFKETDIQDVTVGKKVDISVDAVSKKFYGEVESISAATGATFSLLPPDNATGNFTKVVQRVPVKIKILNLTPADMDLLQAGLSVVVKVHIH
jgi:membrane fusion protein (multidrug efflux system)